MGTCISNEFPGKAKAAGLGPHLKKYGHKAPFLAIKTFPKGLWDHLSCYDIIDWKAYRQQKFISHGSGVWEVQDPGPGRFRVWKGPISWFTDGYLFAVSSHGGRVKASSWGHFYEAVIPFMTHSPPKTHFRHPSHWELGMNIRICQEDTSIQSTARTSAHVHWEAFPSLYSAEPMLLKSASLTLVLATKIFWVTYSSYRIITDQPKTLWV